MGAYLSSFLRQLTMLKRARSSVGLDGDVEMEDANVDGDEGASANVDGDVSLSPVASGSALQPLLEDLNSIDPQYGLPRWAVIEGKKALILYRPCVDCGLKTNNFCQSECLAKWWLPQEKWESDQNTPHCTHCEIKYSKCHYCRQCKWATPPPNGPDFKDCGLDGDGCRLRPEDR